MNFVTFEKKIRDVEHLRVARSNHKYVSSLLGNVKKNHLIRTLLERWILKMQNTFKIKTFKKQVALVP